MKDNNDIKWWEHPFRMLRLDPLGDFTVFQETDMDKHARDLRYKYHCNVEWIMANGGSSPGNASIVNFSSNSFKKNPDIGDFDYVREYLPYAHKYGITVLAYVNLHWFSYDFADTHPGWEQMLVNGEAYGRKNPLYGNGTTFCINSPWRKWAQDLLAEVISTGVDGIFMDGPVVFPGACYCKSCSELFKERTGKDTPKFEDWKNKTWFEWHDFREESMEYFLSDARKTVTSVKEDTVIFLNAGGWSLSTQTACHPWRLEKYQHLTGSEVFVHPGARNEDWLDTTIMAKFLSAGENPAVVFSDHTLGGWHYVGMSDADLKREFYQTVAGGANPWIAVFAPAFEHQREKTMHVVEESWGFLEKNEEFFTGDSPAANVAVLRSETSSLAYLSEIESLSIEVSVAVEKDLIVSVEEQKTGDKAAYKRMCESIITEEFRGWCYTLTRQHIPFSIIRDRDLNENYLKRYDLIVIPNCACLPDKALDALIGFCKNGGNIVSTFESGWYSPDGKLREQNAGGLFLPRQEKLDMFPAAVYEEYSIVEPDGIKIEGFDVNELIPRPVHALKITQPLGSSILFKYLNPIGKHYRKLQGISKYPMVLHGTAGKGGWCYFACLPGADWMRFKIPQWESVMAGVVRILLGDRIQLIAEAPAPVQIELRKQPGRLNLHIINNAGDNQFPISQVMPVGEITVSVKSEKPKSVFSTEKSSIPFSYKNGRTEFSHSLCAQYEIVTLEEQTR